VTGPVSTKALHVAHHVLPHLGGLETVVAAETRGLVARGWDVRVVSSAWGARPGARVEDGVTTVRVWAWNGLEERYGVPFPLFSPRLLTVLRREVRRADVVHVHDALYVSSWVAALWCVLLRTPYVVHRHVGFVHHSSAFVRLVQRTVLGTLGRMVLARATAILAIDEPIAADVRASLPDPDRVVVLGNGVDTTRFRPADDDERRRTRAAYGLPEGPLALFVGRFVPKKGFAVVAAAASDDYAIAFAGGDRPAGADDPRLHFLGALPPERMPAVYACADVLVVASVGECPLTVLEALASGVFVLANDDPALHSPWTEGPGAAHADMAGGALPRALRTAFDDLPALRAAGAAGRARVEAAYSWEAHLDRLEAAYRRAVEQVSICP
jgi:glycosyltransferase involved in cell wall biosynthesis